MQTSRVHSDVLHTPKREYHLTTEQLSVFAPPSGLSRRDLMSQVASSRPLPVGVDGVLDGSQSAQMMTDQGHLESSSEDICLGSESFLQSLESIPLPSLVRNEPAPYNNQMPTYPDLYANSSEAKHLTTMQQELLQAWGSAGPQSNFSNSPGGMGGYVQMAFDPAAGDHSVAPPRCIPRAIRSRGRGRGLRRKITRVVVPRSPQAPPPPFSPRRREPTVFQRDVRAETATTQTQVYATTLMSNQLPQSQVEGSVVQRDTARQATYNGHSSSPPETLLNSEESQANERMNAYIEKFSSESCEMFGPLVSVDTSRKPSTLQEAISMFIDYLVLENEKRTRISCCNILPMPLDFHKEDYYHEIMCQPIAFPTPKFRDWLKLYNVDIEITDPDGQTVSQTTFPPPANFTDTRVNIPTSMHRINWQQQTRGISTTHTSVVANPSLNVTGMMRGRPAKGRAITTGHSTRFGHPSPRAVGDYLPFEFMQGNPVDRAANVRFHRGNVSSCVGIHHHPTSPCGGGVMRQFQTLSLPAIGSMQYFGHGPPVGIPRPYPECASNNPLRMMESFPGAASDYAASNYYRMAPLFNPYPCEMAWRNCYTRPNVLQSDAKTNKTYTEMEAESVTAYMNRPGGQMTSSDNALPSLPPSCSAGMLPPFSSFASGSSTNLSKEADKRFAPVQASNSCSKTCQMGEPAMDDNLEALNFVKEREIETASVYGDGDLSVVDASAATQESRFKWSDAMVRPGSGSVIKEMVDQGCQTEVDRSVADDQNTESAGTASQEEGNPDQEFALDSSMCSFSYNHDFEASRKADDQLNSEILLRNASIILGGGMEADQSIQTRGFASQDELLGSSQEEEEELVGSSQEAGSSTLVDLDGLAMSGDGCIQSFMTVSLTCSSEDPPSSKTSDEMMCSGDGYCDTVDDGYGESGAAGESVVVGLSKSSELLLEVGSNVEINTDGVATVGGGGGGGEGSDYQWVEPRRKRARVSRGRHHRHAVYPWSAKAQRKQHTFEQGSVVACTCKDGDPSVTDGF